jgi:D-ornithine 4,5-aminomutase subunit alpha
MRREDDYLQRRTHLAGLTDEALHQRFWELAEQLVEPMLEAGRRYTTPAIERSVLLRMGFSSVEAKLIVQGAIEHQLMGKGCGHVVWRLAKDQDLTLREAGVRLSQGTGWDEAVRLLRGGKP